MTSKTEHAPGALFEQKQYAGMMRRFAVVVIDAVTIWLAWIAIAITCYNLIWPEEEPLAQATIAWILFIYVYLAIFKATPLRTVGFWIAGVRIVNYRGERPGVLRMTLRFFMWVLGPMNLVVDWLWLGGDRHKQTLRDKFTGTYVVRAKAKPIGTTSRRAAFYNFFGMTFVFVELQPLPQGDAK